MNRNIDRDTWNTFIQTHGPRSGAFLQSWDWGEFQRATGRHVDRHVLEEQGKAFSLCQTQRFPVPFFGHYDYIARGPVLSDSTRLDEVLAGLGEQSIFVRFDPLNDVGGHDAGSSTVKTIAVQPPDTLLTDLTISSEQLEAQLHRKTRYNIGLAKRKGVTVGLSDIELEQVWPLFCQTAKRGQFRLHERAYYQAMLSTLKQEDCRAFLDTAFVADEPVATNVMLDFAGVRTYLHGASSNVQRSSMAPHLLHWTLLLDAKQNGLIGYDWWGVAPKGVKNHPWDGVSRFKRGFGGEEISYPGTFDFVRKPLLYRMYNLSRRARRSVWF
jgi:peptidoglycan pentaglycine glycine transferase (the first glycine)